MQSTLKLIYFFSFVLPPFIKVTPLGVLTDALNEFVHVGVTPWMFCTQWSFFHALLLQKIMATETQWIALHYKSMLITLLTTAEWILAWFYTFKRHIYLVLNGGLPLSIISKSMTLL